MDSSLLPKASSSKRAVLSSSPHELPRWRTPSPMTAALIPRPIVQSTSSISFPPSILAQSVFVEPPSRLQDRQGQLEADLQFLLDAQAEGLVKGLGEGFYDDQASNGSTTPTAQSITSTTTRQQRRLSRRKPGLRSARKGIYNAMLALSSLKEDELADIDDEVREKELKLKQINEWEKKREGLYEATKTTDSDEEAIRAQRLRQEANVLHDEIQAVELQLGDLKTRHRKLVRQAAAVENSVQAKLASYTSSLRLLEEDVQKFLSRDSSQGNAQITMPNSRNSTWQLPPKRRTLEMAKEQWSEEQRSIIQHREGVQHEKAALDEGATIWKEIVAQVTDFERQLRSEVADMSTSPPASSDVLVEERSQRLAALIESIEQLAQFLESNFDFVKERNWNLLIAAVGAEIDALNKGRRMLEAALNPTEEPAGDDDPGLIPGEEIHNLDKSFEAATQRLTNDNDSDPDPELMFAET